MADDFLLTSKSETLGTENRASKLISSLDVRAKSNNWPKYARNKTVTSFLATWSESRVNAWETFIVTSNLAFLVIVLPRSKASHASSLLALCMLAAVWYGYSFHST